MPAKSKAQHRLMGAVASGKAKVKGLSKAEAKEYIKGQKQKGLPEKVKQKPKKAAKKATKKVTKKKVTKKK